MAEEPTYVAGETVKEGDTIVFLGIYCTVTRIEPYRDPEHAGFDIGTRRAYLQDAEGATMTLPLMPRGGVWVVPAA